MGPSGPFFDRSGGLLIGLINIFGLTLHSSLLLWRLLTSYLLLLIQTLSADETSRGKTRKGHLIFLFHLHACVRIVFGLRLVW